MRVLVDECAPKALKHFLIKQGHRCLTVEDAGWSGKQNGDLLGRPNLSLTCSSPSTPIFAISKIWRVGALPSWFSILRPIASSTFATTFPLAVWPLRKSSRVKLFELAILFK